MAKPAAAAIALNAIKQRIGVSITTNLVILAILSPINLIIGTTSFDKPIKAFVVASDVSTAQELERSTIEGASI